MTGVVFCVDVEIMMSWNTSLQVQKVFETTLVQSIGLLFSIRFRRQRRFSRGHFQSWKMNHEEAKKVAYVCSNLGELLLLFVFCSDDEKELATKDDFSRRTHACRVPSNHEVQCRANVSDIGSRVSGTFFTYDHVEGYEANGI